MSKSRLNPFIVIESIDGGGGSTQAKLLAKKAKKEGYSTHEYHFPQENSATGRLIYDKYLNNQNKLKLSRREQALLYIQDFFSQADAMTRARAARKKSILITDRYYTSTLAYQTLGLYGEQRRNHINWIKNICAKGTPVLLKPSAVVLLDTPIEISMQRLKGIKKDHHENKQKLSAFRNNYLRLAKEEKWHVISSVDDREEQRSPKDIHQEIWQRLAKNLKT